MVVTINDKTSSRLFVMSHIQVVWADNFIIITLYSAGIRIPTTRPWWSTTGACWPRTIGSSRTGSTSACGWSKTRNCRCRTSGRSISPSPRSRRPVDYRRRFRNVTTNTVGRDLNCASTDDIFKLRTIQRPPSARMTVSRRASARVFVSSALGCTGHFQI